MSENTNKASWVSLGYILLLIASIVLLVIGLAPVGLLLILREVGLDLTFVAHWNGMAFVIFGLIILGIITIPRGPRGRRIGIWVVCLLAILNMKGCLTLSGLRNIGYIQKNSANKALHPTVNPPVARNL